MKPNREVMKFIDPDSICKKCAGQGKIISEGKLRFSCTHMNCTECQGTGGISGLIDSTSILPSRFPRDHDQYSIPFHKEEKEEVSLSGIKKLNEFSDFSPDMPIASHITFDLPDKPIKRRGRPPASSKASING